MPYATRAEVLSRLPFTWDDPAVDVDSRIASAETALNAQLGSLAPVDREAAPGRWQVCTEIVALRVAAGLAVTVTPASGRALPNAAEVAAGLAMAADELVPLAVSGGPLLVTVAELQGNFGPNAWNPATGKPDYGEAMRMIVQETDSVQGLLYNRAVTPVNPVKSPLLRAMIAQIVRARAQWRVSLVLYPNSEVEQTNREALLAEANRQQKLINDGQIADGEPRGVQTVEDPLGPAVNFSSSSAEGMWS